MTNTDSPTSVSDKGKFLYYTTYFKFHLNKLVAHTRRFGLSKQRLKFKNFYKESRYGK